MFKYFETIKIDNFKVFNLDYHEQRFNNTRAKLYNLKPIQLKSLINPPSNQLLRCKLIYNKDIINISYYPYKPRDIKSFKFIQSDIKYQYKELNRDKIDILYNQKNQNDEIIIVDNNLIKDTSIANIALLIDGIWYTPSNPLHFGTTRERYLREKKIVPAMLSIDDFKNASSIALMNAMIDFYKIEL